MMTRICYILVFFIFTSVSSAEIPQVFDIQKANKILADRKIKASILDLKKLDLSRLGIIRRLGFEDGNVCLSPMPIAAPDIDMHRSLMVHDQATLSAADFSLRRTLNKLASDVSSTVPATSPESIFRQLWDTQNDTPNQVITGKPHCDDNNGKINGIPLNTCPRAEGIEAGGTDADITGRIDNDYKVLALVNRLDLAHEGWRNCGEHRIIYGKSGGGKNFIIFEAVLPNPRPGCRSGCRDVVDFWVDLSNDNNPASRAGKLQNFFYNGLTGFRPVVHTSHYSASGVSSIYGGSGSGQIRTNQFLSRVGVAPQLWTLKEFKTLLSCAGGSCEYELFPISVKVNPYGPLWNRDVATGAAPTATPNNSYDTPVPGLATLAGDFQNSVIAQVTMDKLANPDINSFSYAVELNKNSAESQSQSPTVDHYRNQFNNASDATFRNNLNGVAAGFGLSGEQIVNRATALSCAGCHLPNGFGLTQANSIGPGMSWPSALAFVHVDTGIIDMIGLPDFNINNFSGNSLGSEISPALLSTFLPARKNHLVDLANMDVCDCVRKESPLRLIAAKQKDFRKIVIQSRKVLSDRLDKVEKEFSVNMKTMDATDNRKLFAMQKNVLQEEQKKRESAMAGMGVSFVEPSLTPQAFNLSNQVLPEDKLKMLKSDSVSKIVSSEPPRKTVTGSFRTH